MIIHWFKHLFVHRWSKWSEYPHKCKKKLRIEYRVCFLCEKVELRETD